MDHKQVVKIISTKRYIQQQFNLNHTKLNQLITAINEMEITQDAFKILRILIRYFRFPILILFRKFYDRLEREKKILNFIDDQMTTATIVMHILENKQYPSLQFYTRGGYKPAEQPKKVNQPKQFKDFIFGIDGCIQKIYGEKSKYQIDQLQFTKRSLNEFKKRNMLAPIFNLCIEAYQQMANQRKKQIQSLNQYRPERGIVQYQRNRLQPQKIFIQQGSTIKEIKDPKVSQDYLCCRPYFYQNQIINEPQTIIQQYKNYSYPYNKFLNQTLLKTIVGFLNGRGGIIYIGIRENNDTKKRLIKAETYNQSLKQDVLKHFRYLGQRVSPEIVNNQLYKLQYVPIRDESGFLPGQYIIRLRISKGQRDQLYSFKNYDSQELIAFRTANEVLLRKLGQQILELYRQKLSQLDEPEESNHSGACKKPELGRPLYEDIKKASYYQPPQQKWINKKPQSNIPAEYTILAYLFIGKNIIQDLKPYYHQEYKNLRVIQPTKYEQEQIVRILIETSGYKNQYIPVSLKMTFEQEYFHNAQKTLSEKNIMFAPQRSRTAFTFKVVRQAIYAANILTNLKIPFIFASK